MKTRIEEGIDSGPRTKARLNPEAPIGAAVAPAGGWTIGDLISFFKDSFSNQSDQTEDAPP
jgi:hypothetical protein